MLKLCSSTALDLIVAFKSKEGLLLHKCPST